MTALLTAAEIGRAAEGGGPQALGQPLRHHRTPASTQVVDAASVPGNVRPFHLPTAHATPRSMGR